MTSSYYDEDVAARRWAKKILTYLFLTLLISGKVSDIIVAECIREEDDSKVGLAKRLNMGLSVATIFILFPFFWITMKLRHYNMFRCLSLAVLLILSSELATFIGVVYNKWLIGLLVGQILLVCYTCGGIQELFQEKMKKEADEETHLQMNHVITSNGAVLQPADRPSGANLWTSLFLPSSRC